MLNLKDEYIRFLKKNNLYARYIYFLHNQSVWDSISVQHFFNIVTATNYGISMHMYYPNNTNYNEWSKRFSELFYGEALWIIYLIEHHHEVDICFRRLMGVVGRIGDDVVRLHPELVYKIDSLLRKYHNTEELNDGVFKHIDSILYYYRRALANVEHVQ